MTDVGKGQHDSKFSNLSYSIDRHIVKQNVECIEMIHFIRIYMCQSLYKMIYIYTVVK